MLLKVLVIIIFASIAIISSIPSSVSQSEEDIEELEFNLGFDDVDHDIFDTEIKIENQKLFTEFVKEQIKKFEKNIDKIEEFISLYYLKADGNDDFPQITIQLNLQQEIIYSIKEILHDPKSLSSPNQFKKTIAEKEIFEKLINSALRIEKDLLKLQHWDNFDTVATKADEQLHLIQQFKDVTENPQQIPKRSHLLMKKKVNETNEYYEALNRMRKNDEEVYGFAIAETEVYVNLSIYGAQTQRTLGSMGVHKDKFISDLSQILQHPKFSSIIFDFSSLENSNYYIKETRKIVDTINTPYLFISFPRHQQSAMLIAADVDVNINDHVVLVIMGSDEKRYIVIELKYTEAGYVRVEENMYPNFKEMEHEKIQQQIIGQNNPAKIILFFRDPNSPNMKVLKEKILKNVLNKLIVLEGDLRRYDPKFVAETTKHISDNCYTKFHIATTSNKNYYIGFECGGKKYPLIHCKKGEILPFKKQLSISRTPLKYFFGHAYENDDEMIVEHVFELSQEAHVYFLTLKVGESMFVDPSASEAFSGRIPAFIKTLNEKPDMKIPVIGFYFELSFIFIYSEDSTCYKILNSWNGKLGRDLFVSFDEEEPQFFEDALKQYQTKCDSVVHDIIDTMSKPLKETYGYSITSDSENLVLFEYTNFDGSKRTSTPAEIMSLLLKEHLKAIKEETGEIPTKIAFSLLEDFDEASMNRINDELKKSCDLINLECSFIDSDFSSLVQKLKEGL